MLTLSSQIVVENGHFVVGRFGIVASMIHTVDGLVLLEDTAAFIHLLGTWTAKLHCLLGA